MIDEGSHGLLINKREGAILETDRIRPSVTIIRGQNSAVISHRTGEICDCGFVIKIKIESCNGHRRIEKSEDEIGEI
jgi:hypothetical protein